MAAGNMINSTISQITIIYQSDKHLRAQRKGCNVGTRHHQPNSNKQRQKKPSKWRMFAPARVCNRCPDTPSAVQTVT